MAQRHRLSRTEKKDLANQILGYLSERTYPVQASLVFGGIEYSGPEYNVRRMLQRLADRGVIERTDAPGYTNRFRWKLTNHDWDRDNPFRFYRKDGAPVSEADLRDFQEEDDRDEDIPDDEEENEPVVATVPNTKVAELEQRVISLEEALKAQQDYNVAVSKDMEDIKKELEEKRGGIRVIEIKKYDGKTIKLKDQVLPKEFDKVLSLAKCRRNILLVGPAGCGKTYLARKAAIALDLEFGSISCTAGMSEAHLLGRAVPDLTHGKNRHQTTDFLNIYEGGGVFLFDELDAADSNMLLSINTGIANDYLNVPNRPEKPKAIRHEDFVCIATANTFGRGANRVYAGRNQIDESTLDRFRMGTVEMDYSREVELSLCHDKALRERCWSIRAKIDKAGIRRIMSTRFMEDAQIMLNEGWTVEQILDTYFLGWTDEEKAKVK